MCNKKYDELTEEQRQKRRDAARNYYHKHREKRLVYQKEYNSKHRDKNLVYQNEYYAKNKEILLTDKKQYYQNVSKVRYKHQENLRYQKAYYRKTNLDQSTWKITMAPPAEIVHESFIVSFD